MHRSQGGPVAATVFKCGKLGHVARDCKDKPQAAPARNVGTYHFGCLEVVEGAELDKIRGRAPGSNAFAALFEEDADIEEPCWRPLVGLLRRLD